MSRRLSSDNIHATTVAAEGRAVLLCGRSGSGKSDLALQLIDRGFTLVSDDRTMLRADSGRLVASPPATIRGKMEVRGIGIFQMDNLDEAFVALAVDLDSEMERLPEKSDREWLGILIPAVSIDARSPSAAAKVVLALNRLGLAP